MVFLAAFFLPKAPAHAAPIKILIVPGHDDTVWGAQYGNIKEADMNLVLATDLYNDLKKDSRFEVHITRNSAGYTKEFSDYFAAKHDDIVAFRAAAKKSMQENVASGDFTSDPDNVPHHDVSEDVANILYGINMWADDNNMDAVIHVHFNDYPRPSAWTAGTYKGFAVYMPEAQMSNAAESDKLAKSIFTQLKSKYMTSTYPKEAASGGLVPDQTLIAMGSNNTLETSVRSVLIEYGYIYRFANSVFRHAFYPKAAALTAAGITNYFFPK